MAEAEDVSLSKLHRKITLNKLINFACTFKQICAVVQEIQVDATARVPNYHIYPMSAFGVFGHCLPMFDS